MAIINHNSTCSCCETVSQQEYFTNMYRHGQMESGPFSITSVK